MVDIGYFNDIFLSALVISLSLLVVTQIQGHIAGSSPPPTHYGTYLALGLSTLGALSAVDLFLLNLVRDSSQSEREQTPVGLQSRLIPTFSPTPFITFALHFSLSPSCNSDPGSHSRLFCPPPLRFVPCIFIARRFQLFLTSPIICRNGRSGKSALEIELQPFVDLPRILLAHALPLSST